MEGDCGGRGSNARWASLVPSLDVYLQRGVCVDPSCNLFDFELDDVRDGMRYRTDKRFQCRMRVCSVAVGVLLLAGCSTVDRLPPPDGRVLDASLPGIPNARFWGDVAPVDGAERVARLKKQIKAHDSARVLKEPIYFLALSGGGQKGAFGAGLLAGWSASGTRPEFQIVTGISTGALIAPFAFLGTEYDPVIEKLYTEYSAKDLLKLKPVRGFFGSGALAENSLLRKILMRYFTPKEMELIAQEYTKGRRLFIGTTHLDCQRPMIWDIGVIAGSGHPDAYERIIDIMLASAAIPGAFPPVYFRVERDGVLYDEMHVDGGVTSQVFFYPTSFSMRETMDALGFSGEAHLYLIRNASLRPERTPVSPHTVPIVTQSLRTLLRAQGIGDMYRMYFDAQEEGISYQSAFIPADFRAEPEEQFDVHYMAELFHYAFDLAQAGYPWCTAPPEFSSGQ